MALDKIFRDLISNPTAIDMVKSVLGDDFLISNFTANIARPGSKSMALQYVTITELKHDFQMLTQVIVRTKASSFPTRGMTSGS